MFDDFSSFLNALSNPQDRSFQSAWREFEDRYKLLILGKLHRMTRDEEIVRESFARTMTRLVEKDFKVIKDFRERESESAFRVFLTVVARSMALALFKELSIKRLDDVEMPSTEQTQHAVDAKVKLRLDLTARHLTMKRLIVLRTILPRLRRRQEHAVIVIRPGLAHKRPVGTITDG